MKKKDNNLNSTFNTSQNNDFNSDFNLALQLSEKEISHGELIKFLKSGNIAQRQIAALRLSKLDSEDDVDAFLDNLCGQDGKIREAVALRLSEFVKDDTLCSLVLADRNFSIILKSLVDVNGNVCRCILDTFEYLKKDNSFCRFMVEKLPQAIDFTFEELEKFKFNDKQHVINKAVFRLYWYLEGVISLLDEFDDLTLESILLKSGRFEDYTIREKVAKILCSRVFSSPELSKLKKDLSSDENYYVRRFFD